MLKVNAYVQKIGPRQFEATVILEGGVAISALGGQRRGAIKALHEACDRYHEQFEDCEPLPPREFLIEDIPDLGSEVEEESSSEAAVAEEEDEEESEDFEERIQNLLGAPAVSGVKIPGMDKGWVTPISDLETWIDYYRGVISRLASLGQDDDKPIAWRDYEEIARYRKEANEIMHSVGCVGPWDRMPSGDFWLRLANGEKDPTVRSFRRGEGNRRERIRRWVKNELPERYTYDGGDVEQRLLAQRTGKLFQDQMRDNLAAAGQSNPELLKLFYKLGYVVSLRSQGLPPHEKFEQELIAGGLTEEKIQAYISKSAGIAVGE